MDDSFDFFSLALRSAGLTYLPATPPFEAVFLRRVFFNMIVKIKISEIKSYCSQSNKIKLVSGKLGACRANLCSH